MPMLIARNIGFPATTIPSDATLLVRVTSGTIGVYDASLDNTSIGDLVVSDVEGDYHGTTPRPFFILLVTLQIPGTGATISFTCGGHPFEIPIFHGAQAAETVGFSLQDPDYELPVRFEYPGGLETAYARVRPIRPQGCP